MLEQVKSSTTKKERLKKLEKLEKFNEAMPGYNKIVADTKNRLKGFLIRIKGVRGFINKLRAKLSPILEPFFDDIGLPFDLVWPELTDKDVEDATQLYEGEEFVFEDDFGDDAFGAGGFDFTESKLVRV